MEPTKLVRMANQIAANLNYGPEESKCVAGVADHLRRFWTPLMFHEVSRYMASGDAELSAIAQQALTQLIEERRAGG